MAKPNKLPVLQLSKSKTQLFAELVIWDREVDHVAVLKRSDLRISMELANLFVVALITRLGSYN